MSLAYSAWHIGEVSLMLTIISIIVLAKLWTVVCQTYPNPPQKRSTSGMGDGGNGEVSR